MADKLHLCSLNCQGLGQKDKRQRLIQWGNKQKSNILFLQETHFTNEIINNLNREFSEQMYMYHSFGTKQSKGVSIFIKKNFTHNIIDQYQDKEGRVILLNIEIENNIITLVNLYAPNTEKERNTYFKTVQNFIKIHSLGILIIGGDMNESLTVLDRKSKVKRNAKKNKNNSLKILIKTLKLVDIWRVLYPQKEQYTWRRKNNQNSASRIDFFLINHDLRPKIISSDIRPAMIKYTDHQAISLKINLSQEEKGKGYFKL